MTHKIYYEDEGALALKIHDWFARHPLGTTEEGFDHFQEFFSRLIEPYSEQTYRNFN